jgi:hypothetical protein
MTRYEDAKLLMNMYVFFSYLFTTYVLESIYINIISHDFRKQLKRSLLTILAVNLLTNPTLNYIFIFKSFNLDPIVLLIFGELSATIIEAILYKKIMGISYKKAFLISLTANIVSLVLGTYLIVHFHLYNMFNYILSLFL